MKLFELFGVAPQEKKSTKDRKKVPYNFESLRQLQEPIENVVEKLKKEIETGTYDVLISDDASARLPALALREILTARIHKKNPDPTPEEKRESLKTFFVAGGRNMKNDAELEEFFQKIKPDVRKRALLVTEYISTGKSLQRLMNLLDKAGILYDVAAVMAAHSEQDYKSIFSNYLYMHRMVIGATGKDEPEIYNAGRLSGVVKDPFSPQQSAHPVSYKGGEFEPLNEDGLAEEKQKARDDVRMLAQEVLKEVWEK